MRVAVQVPAIDEPPGQFRETLERIAGATTEEFDPVYEAWVTKVSEPDVTMNVAEESGYETYEAPEGKISARNVAHERAFSDGCDAVISIDADAPPIQDDALDNLVRPIRTGEAVATNSVPLSSVGPDGDFSLFGALVDVGGYLEDLAAPHLHGQASAIGREAWEEAGPFDESVDQKDGIDIRSEEEFGFYHRVREVGEVVYPEGATVYNDPRRHACKVPLLADQDYCQRIGEVTFSPEG